MNNIGNPDLIRNQEELSRRCDELIKDMAREGDLAAQAEYNYYLQKTKTAYRLQDEGMSATMIGVVLKGEPEVAILMREMNISKSRYDATKEAINIVKLQMRMTDAQINREWGRNE